MQIRASIQLDQEQINKQLRHQINKQLKKLIKEQVDKSVWNEWARKEIRNKVYEAMNNEKT